MSDSRFHLKVDFEIYGSKFHWNPSLNWSDNGDGIDQRIFDWFRDCYGEARGKFDEANYRAGEAARVQAEEKAEREQLAKLKAKYEGA